jgi:hypothetical protein
MARWFSEELVQALVVDFAFTSLRQRRLVKAKAIFGIKRGSGGWGNLTEWAIDLAQLSEVPWSGGFCRLHVSLFIGPL